MKLILTENIEKIPLSEGMKYHLDNKLSLDESEFRMGSTAWCDLVNEARELYFRGHILINEAEKIIIESNAGSFGEYNGEDVPLDAPFPIDEAGNFAVFCLNENNETVRVVFSEAKDSLLNEIESKTSSITAYHGSNVKHSSFVTDYVGGENANDEQGPGLYFTTDKADAMKYGDYLYTVTLTLKNVISDKKRLSKTDLNLAARLIKTKDAETWQSIAQNWHMNPVIGLKQAIRDSSDVENQKDFFLNIWYDWFLYDAKSFVDGMVNFGIDGLEINQPYKSSWGTSSDFKHYIVYNPKCITIQSVDAVDMMNENTDNYKKWKRKNVTLRGIKTLGQPNNVSGQFGKGLYTVPLSNKSMAKQYGEIYFVVNAIPKNPVVVDSLNGAEMWRQKLMIDFCEKHGLPFDIRHFEANTTIEDEMLKLGYDGLIIKGREMVNYAPEDIRYFKTEADLIGYFERTIVNL